MSSQFENRHSDPSRLSNMSTNWDELIAAHDDERVDSEGARLRGEILRRYSECVFRYILGATKSHHVTEDLTQEFALRFVRGDFKNANPKQGRFRDYLKVSLRNLATDHFRSEPKDENIESIGIHQFQEAAVDSLEANFADQWRQRVLSITWNALKEFESSKQTLYYSVLFLRTEHPNASSEELARIFSQQSDRPVNADWIRQTLRRSRLKFADLLIEEVGKTLNSNVRQEIIDELADLGLKKYVDAN